MVKHPVSLRGYYAASNDYSAPPLLVKRLDAQFVPGLLSGLRQRQEPADLGALGTADLRDGQWKLFQPLHRTFNLTVLEAVCQSPGSPRLDPRQIDSAGFVIRRITNLSQPALDEAWRLRDEQPIGWRKPQDPALDPDPTRRRPRLNAGNDYINQKLAALTHDLEPAGERVSPLFVAPPDVCAAASRTLLYGLVPVSSAESSEPSPETPPIELDPADVQAITPGFLLAVGLDGAPDIRGSIELADFDNALAAGMPSLDDFVQDLRLLQFGWQVFDSPEGGAILALLNRITVGLGGDAQSLGDYLQFACKRLILRTDGTDALPIPHPWPKPDAVLAGQIREAARISMQANLSANVASQKRFDEPAALYRLHAFIRVRGPEGCPPALQWSQPSAPFGIVPWWESGGGPIHTINLPDLTADNIKRLKPNVAFALPPSLAALLRINQPKDFIDGAKTPGGGDIGIGWICSFSLPVITLCAFIVLNIFLVLLNLVFQWLFYIKICLPIPKKQPAAQP